MKNLTPYLKSLKAFESTARLGSFSEAGKELFVTSAAVGQLVKQLENQLGITLFHRTKGGQARLVMTEPAKNALADIQAGFAKLEQGLAKLTPTPTNQLTITASPAFTAKWLLPRLDEFQAAYPDIAVRLHTDSKVLDFDTHGIDVGIRYGRGEWADLASEKLFDEAVFPVCSPKFAETHRLTTPADLLGCPLIHDVSMEGYQGFASWAGWFEQAGVPTVLIKPSLQINNSASVLQAVIDGQGVALARSQIAMDDVNAGRLIRLFDEVDYRSELAYFVVWPAHKGESEAVRVFREWVFSHSSSIR